MKFNKSQAVLVTSLWLATATGMASATVYTNRIDFESVIQNMTMLDFENLVGTPDYPQNYPFGTGHMSTSVTIQNIMFSDVLSAGSDDYVYILGNDGAGASVSLDGTTMLLLGRASARISLPTGVTAFGSDFGLGAHAIGAMTATLYFRDTASPESFELTAAADSQFFGYTGHEIDHIALVHNESDYMVFDNMSFAQTVPEPETYALMVVGLGLVGVMARRRA